MVCGLCGVKCHLHLLNVCLEFAIKTKEEEAVAKITSVWSV